MLDEAVSGRDRIHAYVLDVTDADDVETFVRTVVATHLWINVLVNNAGVYNTEAVTGPRDLSDAKRMIETNIVGPIRMTDALVDHLRTQLDAVIINVTSGLAFVPYPAALTYNATKAAMHAYTAAIRPLLRGTIEVIEIVPPQVQTNLSPGQSDDPNDMPIDEFADEIMTLLHTAVTPAEICVYCV